MSTTSNIGVLSTDFNLAMSKALLVKMEEDPQINWLGQANLPLQADKYEKVIYGHSLGVRGAERLGGSIKAMETPKSKRLYNLYWQYGDIYYDINDLTIEGTYLAQRKAAELAKIERSIKLAAFKGVFTEGFDSAGAGAGVRMNDGIIEQASIVLDLDGTNSALVAAGDVMKALDKMQASIPFELRDGKRLIVGFDDLFAQKARTALFRGSTNQQSELDLWLAENSGAMAFNGQMVNPSPIISNALFLNTVAGTTKTETDTLGTHSRIFMAAVNPDSIEIATSFLGYVGTELSPLSQGAAQRFGAKICGCVHDTDAVVYSEQITWV